MRLLSSAVILVFLSAGSVVAQTFQCETIGKNLRCTIVEEKSPMTPEEVFYKHCATVLKDRLLSPSSYRLYKRSNVSIRPATVEECMGWDDPQKKKAEKETLIRRFWNGKSKEELEALQEEIRSRQRSCQKTLPTTITMTIRYEATNQYGGMTQRVAVCSVTMPIDPSEVSPDTIPVEAIRINGITMSNWLYYGLPWE